MTEGRLLASGRDGDIFEYGPALVLRKARDGRSIAHEARIMEHVAERGYPVPRIEDVRNDGTEIVMERIDGPMMMHAIQKDLRSLRRSASLLADLHDQLHEITAPEWLRVLDEDGDRLLHLDLHPLNVMMSPRGPVVIDWGNAARGRPLTDIGMTYALLVAPRMPAPWIVSQLLQPARVLLARTFTARYRGPDLDRAIGYAAELKVLDPNMDAWERKRLERIVRRRTPRAPGCQTPRAPG